MKEIIKNLKIENFKKFDYLEVKNIGQINLITGDNNVGKTSFLEALLFSEDNLLWISYLHLLLDKRLIHIHPLNIHSKNVTWPENHFLAYLIKDINKPLKINYENYSNKKNQLELKYLKYENLSDEIKKLRKDNYDFERLKDWVLFTKNGQNTELQWLYFDEYTSRGKLTYWPYISFNLTYDSDLHDFVDSLSKKTNEFNNDTKERIIELMKIYIPDFKDYELRIFGDLKLIALATNENPKYRPLTQQGDGAQKFFRYIVEILYAEKMGESRIMIDEIDTGTHYLMLPKLWRSIFELSKKTGVQIFATTHSMDCINSYLEVGDEIENIKSQIRLIELEEFKDKENKTKHIATTYDFETLKFKLETDTNVRGGDLWQ